MTNNDAIVVEKKINVQNIIVIIKGGGRYFETINVTIIYRVVISNNFKFQHNTFFIVKLYLFIYLLHSIYIYL